MCRGLLAIEAWNKDAFFMSASRTDKCVSALENTIAFDSDFRTGELASALEANMDKVYVMAVADVPDGFDPRKAQSRRYVYFMPMEPRFNVEWGKKYASLFLGKHDFENLSKRSKEDVRTTEKEVLDISLKRDGPLLMLEVEGKSFLWQQVRRMAWTVREAMMGRLTVDDFGLVMDGSVQTGALPGRHLWLTKVNDDRITYHLHRSKKLSHRIFSEKVRSRFFSQISVAASTLK